MKRRPFLKAIAVLPAALMLPWKQDFDACGSCGVDATNSELCWYCHGWLCSDCWERVGHCGHPEAHEANRVARGVPRFSERDMAYWRENFQKAHRHWQARGLSDKGTA